MKQMKSKRIFLKGLGLSASTAWITPLVTSVVMPAHAQTTIVITAAPPKLYSIGDTGPCGGKVFEISNGGLNGKEAAPANLPGTYTWVAAINSASSYMNGGCSDWYLPNKAELNTLYINKDNIGGILSYVYWSSTPLGSFTAWLQFFGNGLQDFNNRGLNYRVRAIRAF